MSQIKLSSKHPQDWSGNLRWYLFNSLYETQNNKCVYFRILSRSLVISFTIAGTMSPKSLWVETPSSIVYVNNIWRWNFEEVFRFRQDYKGGGQVLEFVVLHRRLELPQLIYRPV